jgi:hypothetical protein
LCGPFPAIEPFALAYCPVDAGPPMSRLSGVSAAVAYLAKVIPVRGDRQDLPIGVHPGCDFGDPAIRSISISVARSVTIVSAMALMSNFAVAFTGLSARLMDPVANRIVFAFNGIEHPATARRVSSGICRTVFTTRQEHLRTQTY